VGPTALVHRQAVDSDGPSPGPDASWPARRAAVVAAVVAGVALRLWNVGGARATFDEAYTGVYSHLPVGQIAGALRAEDAHPPLDYLLRHAFGGIGDTVALRAPSVVMGIVTLLVVALWVGRRGWWGVAAVALTSCSSFHLLYARTARPYALLILCGVVAAIAAERWLETGAPRWRNLAAVVVAVALFDHTTGMFLAGGLVLIPGLRRDREAWRWRAAMVAAVVLWAVVWGPSFVDQARRTNSSWIPLTTPRGMIEAINGLVDMTPAAGIPVVVALVFGGVALVRLDPRLGRVWLCTFVAPTAAVCVAGLHAHVLLARSLAISAWAPAFALAALLDAARRSSARNAIVTGTAVVAVVAPSILPALSVEDPGTPARAALAAVVAPGDGVVVHPDWFWPVTSWDLRAPRTEPVPLVLDHIDGNRFVHGDAPFTGRVWVINPTSYPLAVDDLEPCGVLAPPPGDWIVRCFLAPS
jgi:hypothetical protein